MHFYADMHTGFEMEQLLDLLLEKAMRSQYYISDASVVVATIDVITFVFNPLTLY